MGAIALDFAAVAAVEQRPRAETASLVKRAWLLLYAEGGRWEPAEIARRMRVAPRKVTWLLAEMVEREYTVRTDTVTPEGAPLAKYGVTSACRVPRGVVVQELQELIPAPAGQEQVQ